MSRIFCILFILSLSAACNNESENRRESDTTTAVIKMPGTDTVQVADAHDARNSLDWAGTYSGVLPCADCEGIETGVVLNADNTYMYSAKYLGKKDEKLYKEEGKWKWLDGANIELEGLKNRPSKYFVSEGRILQLDGEGKKIGGALAQKYILTKSK